MLSIAELTWESKLLALHYCRPANKQFVEGAAFVPPRRIKTGQWILHVLCLVISPVWSMFFFFLKNVRSVGTIVSIRSTSSYIPLRYRSQCPSTEHTPVSSRVFNWRSVSLVSSASNESSRLVSVYLAICMASFHSTQTDTHRPRYTYVGTYVHTRRRAHEGRTYAHTLSHAYIAKSM